MRAIFAALAASFALTAGEATAVPVVDMGHDSTTEWGFQWQVWAEAGGLGRVEKGRKAQDYIDEETWVFSQSPFTPDKILAHSRATGDLERGMLGASSIFTLGRFQGRGQTDVSMFDRIQFDLRHLDTATWIDIPIRVDLMGSLAPAPWRTLANFGLAIGSFYDGLYVNRNWEGTGAIQVAPITNTQTTGDWDKLDGGLYEGKFSLRGGVVNNVSFFMQLGTYGTANLGNSAYFTMDTDLPFTSASGVFLTNPYDGGVPPLAPVPLPGAGGLLAAAAGILGAIRFTRRDKSIV